MKFLPFVASVTKPELNILIIMISCNVMQEIELWKFEWLIEEKDRKIKSC
jgi:hypothetical protein